MHAIQDLSGTADRAGRQGRRPVIHCTCQTLFDSTSAVNPLKSLPHYRPIFPPRVCCIMAKLRGALNSRGDVERLALWTHVCHLQIGGYRNKHMSLMKQANPSSVTLRQKQLLSAGRQIRNSMYQSRGVHLGGGQLLSQLHMVLRRASAVQLVRALHRCTELPRARIVVACTPPTAQDRQPPDLLWLRRTH